MYKSTSSMKRMLTAALWKRQKQANVYLPGFGYIMVHSSDAIPASGKNKGTRTTLNMDKSARISLDKAKLICGARDRTQLP